MKNSMFKAGWQKMSLQCIVEEVARERKGKPENVSWKPRGRRYKDGAVNCI